jgi:hypothetical protein
MAIINMKQNASISYSVINFQTRSAYHRVYKFF